MNLLTSLRYLVALDEHKHFGRAALACHITQPALSNALRALEQEFGTTIINRGRVFGGLTAEGERVLASAQRMLHEREVLQQDLSSVANQPVGHIVIGAVPTAVPIAARFAAMLQARHPGISPTVLSMTSDDIEKGLEKLSLDLGLGYTDRLALRQSRLRSLAQYTEHYFLVRKTAAPEVPQARLKIGTQISWKQAAALPLCLLTPDMHNRTIVDAAFLKAGLVVKPIIETNSILTLALSVVAGEVCSILPGALLDAVRGYTELEALPLVEPDILTPIGFMMPQSERTSRTQQAAAALAQDAAWLRHAAAHSGLLSA
ncbi:MAG: LysR substrate-binding domain-containing protein [Burkholderiaceae bacterium]|nr:LysR substrate-binding domain-containing protein [Burkholderiaceae bacterium]